MISTFNPSNTLTQKNVRMMVIATTCNIDQYNKWMHIRIITPVLHHSSECVGS
jgi:hypothetical protein